MNTPINDTLDILIRLPAEEIIAAQNRKADKLETDGISIPKRLDRKIRRQLNKAIFKNEYANVSRVAKRIATVMLVFCTCSFAFSMSIKAVREELYNTIITWYEKYFTVSYNTDTTVGNDEYTVETTESTAISEGTAKEIPTTIEEKREPQLVPAGLTKKVAKDDRAGYILTYYNAEGKTLQYSQTILKSDKKYDAENVNEIHNVCVNNYEALILTYNDDPATRLLWSDGEYSYKITDYAGTMSKDLLTLIGESVK